MENIGAAVFIDEDEVFHDAAAEPTKPTDVLLSSIQDGIVADRTNKCYTTEIFSMYRYSTKEEIPIINIVYYIITTILNSIWVVSHCIQKSKIEVYLVLSTLWRKIT
jgi:hypothetical protein